MAATCSTRDITEPISRRYADKVVIVTGGSRGIGEALVITFVKHGAKVVFCSNEDVYGPKLEETVNNEYTGACSFKLCDMNKEEDIKGLIDFTVDKFGRLDCLINNAGFHPVYQPIDDFTGQDFMNLLTINVVGYFLAAKHSLPHIRKVGGCIINNASMVGHLGQKHAVTYASTKGAVLSMTKALAIDESVHNVRVNSVSISNVMTPLWEDGFSSMTEEEQKIRIQAGKDVQLFGRFGTLDEIGKTFLYLAADATFCTGIDIKFSGGCELNYGKKTQMNKRGDSIFS